MLLSIMVLGVATCSAEDLKFIDSSDDIGYFVDMDTVKVIDSRVFTVDMIVIRLNLNRMEIADTRIDHAAKQYTIRSTRTLSYDDRTELSADRRQRPARNYSDKSLFNDIVNIIIYGGE